MYSQLYSRINLIKPIMKLKKNIATSENGFIFNPSTGDSFSSNGIAAEILGLMKAGKTSPEIKQHILDNYEVDDAQLERDWEDWILQLKDANLLEQ
jgi:hypothetical protein